jgi:hypothetical protein
MHNLRRGQEVSITQPLQNFPLNYGRPGYVLAAGAIGITAMVAMGTALKARGADYRFVYGARSRNLMAFLDELVPEHGDRLDLRIDDEGSSLDVADLVAGVPDGRRAHCWASAPGDEHPFRPPKTFFDMSERISLGAALRADQRRERVSMSDAEPGVPGVGRPRPADAPASRSVTLRATAVLGAFDREHRCLNLSQLSRRSGLPLATVHRLAADLVEGRLLVRRGDGRYEIGARMWRLGLLAPATDLRELALPHLQDHPHPPQPWWPPSPALHRGG